MDFVSGSPGTIYNNLGEVTWTFSNLMPFECREAFVQLDFNSPTDIVNSHDPNDKICLQGPTVGIDKIGEYVHYCIRFENTGTANALNVVVKDVIDEAKFDVNSLVPLSGSHPFQTRIKPGNIVEFFFENINLPFDDESNDGYVVFKIRTSADLTQGDVFSNFASIYFDYNAPILTEAFNTEITSLGINGAVITNTLFVNPVQDHIRFSEKVDKITLFDMLGRIVADLNVHSDHADLSLAKFRNLLNPRQN
jgi:hypothetical protein